MKLFCHALQCAVVLSTIVFTHALSQVHDTISTERQKAQKINSDYYQSAYALSGTALRSALHNLIDGHTVISYDGLYAAFPTTDSKSNGKIWDIYSDVPGGTPAYEYSYGVKKCGNYSKEGDCYNREHSWPDSWLGETNPARSDLFHMYPTDGYVNNRRSNYPFGTVSAATWTSTNGSKVGPNTGSGYSGTVFEPINEYKGDLARSMMYMSVRYYTEDGGFSTSPATNKSDLLSWYADLLYTWHINDTVSTKEINRNNAIETFQKNRNPFIDHPEFAAEIWRTASAPAVVSVIPLTTTKVMFDFSRCLDSAMSVSPENFTINQSIGSPVSVQWGVNNDFSRIVLTTAALTPALSYAVQIRNLKSINNVAMNDTTVTFIASGTTGIDSEKEIFSSYGLRQNYPNPFNPVTTIEYEVRNGGHVSLKVFDVLGKETAILVDDVKSSGVYRASFDASTLPSGMYMYRLIAGNYAGVKRMVFQK